LNEGHAEARSEQCSDYGFAPIVYSQTQDLGNEVIWPGNTSLSYEESCPAGLLDLPSSSGVTLSNDNAVNQNHYTPVAATFVRLPSASTSIMDPRAYHLDATIGGGASSWDWIATNAFDTYIPSNAASSGSVVPLGTHAWLGGPAPAPAWNGIAESATCELIPTVSTSAGLQQQVVYNYQTQPQPQVWTHSTQTIDDICGVSSTHASSGVSDFDVSSLDQTFFSEHMADAFLDVQKCLDGPSAYEFRN
jgi:hypothetical protein